MIEKKCTRCQVTKPATQYHRSVHSKNGYYSMCKSCKNLAAANCRKTPRGKAAKRRYKASKKGKLSKKKYQKENIEKVKARRAVSRAVMSGKILPVNNLPCQICGEQAEQRHHYLGYSRKHWLDTIPLCRGCHFIEDGVKT